MIDWWMNPQYPSAAALFGDIDRVFALAGERITSDSLSRVLRVSAAGKRYYVKCYSGTGKSPLRRWFGLTERLFLYATAVWFLTASLTLPPL